MSKVIAAINMTLDGYCDHTSSIPDDDIHYHYAELLNNSGAAIYGRITYELMEYWRQFIDSPSGDKSMNEFAITIDRIPKLVFSKTLENVDWKSARIAEMSLKDELLLLKKETEKDILICSPSMIVQYPNLKLIDEFQICIHPVLAAGGLALFKNLTEKENLKLIKTKVFNFGGVILYYRIEH